MTEERGDRPEVFVSYAAGDQDWVRGVLLAAFEDAGIRYHDEQQFILGRPRLNEFEDGIRRSDSVVLVLSPAWAADQEAGFVDLLAARYGHETGVWPVVPVVLHPVQLPLHLSILTVLDLTDEQQWASGVRQLCERLRHGTVGADRDTSAARPPCPYRGMSPLEETDPIYGRDEAIEEAIQRLRIHPWLAVIGPSGSGKSSLARAGIVPVARSRGTRVLTLRPGTRPVDNLQAALTAAADGGDASRLLVVDQLEEMFAAGHQVEEFCRRLIELTRYGGTAVLFAMRADFYPQLMTSPLWPETRDHRMEVVPLTGPELRDAIVQPATSVQVYVEAALVERLMIDAAGQPGSMPLLQETLVCLWERLTYRYLPMSAYDALVLSRHSYGERPRTGLQVALSRRADQALSELSDDGKPIARRILLRLVQFVDGRDDVRRQQPVEALLAENDDPQLFAQVLGLLTERRLVSVTGRPGSDEKLVDLAHEAMISGWPTFQGWLEDRRAAERTRRRLQAEVDDRKSRDSAGGLLDEVELREAELWLGSPDAAEVGASKGIVDLVAASRSALEADRRRKRRIAWALRTLTAGLALLLVVAVGAAVVADRQRARAAEAELTARSGELALAATSLPAEEVDRALLLSQEAIGLASTARSRGSLLATLSSNPRVIRLMHTPDGVNTLAVSPGGRRAVAGGSDGSIVVWDLASGRTVSVQHLPGDVRAVDFSPDGRWIVAAGSVGTVQQFAADTGQPRGQPLRVHHGKVRAVRYSPDGTLLASAGDDKVIILSSAADGTVVRPLPGHTEWVDSLAFGGGILASGGGFSEDRSKDNRILIWNPRTGRRLRTLTGHDNAVRSLAVTPDGRQLVSGSADKTVRVWNLVGTGPASVLAGHTERVFGVAVSPDGRLIASAGRDHELRVWRRDGSAPPLLLRGHAQSVRATAFAGPETLVSAGNDGRVFVWDLRTRTPPRLAAAVAGQPKAVRAVATSPDGSLVATGSDDGRVLIRDAGTGAARGPELQPGAPVSGAAFAPDSRTLLTITDGGALDSWDTATGARRAPTALTGDAYPIVAVSPDGTRIATGGRRQDEPRLQAGVVRLWSPDLRPLGTLPGARSWVRGLAYRGDGALAATGADGIAWLWTGPSDRPVVYQVNQAANEMTVAAFSPDGRTLATGDRDGGIVLWDPSAEQAKATSRPGAKDHEGNPVTAISYSADGHHVVTADASGLVLLWDTDGGNLRRVGVLARLDEVSTAALRPDGTSVMIGTTAGPVRVSTDPGDWRHIACRIAGRNLQPVEISTFIGGDYHKTCPDLPAFDRRPGQVIADD